VRSTIFHRDEPKFNKAVKDFGPSSAARVLADIDDFELDWRNGMEENQLFARYDFKPLKGIRRPYGLFQLHVGPNRKHLSYRTVVMFYDERSRACWVHAFKKDPKSEAEEINRAVARADEYWNKIKGVQ
jgi:hypothetical protein